MIIKDVLQAIEDARHNYGISEILREIKKAYPDTWAMIEREGE